MSVVRTRLAAQRLMPGGAAADVREAARAVCGVQAQDVRAAALALRSRVSGLARSDVDQAGLVRTWTVRGTLHLVDPDDLAWLYAACAPRFLARYQGMLEKRGQFDDVRGMLEDVLALVADEPVDRATIVTELAARGHPDLGPESVNVLMPWIALQGLVAGTSDGRWQRSEPPPPMDLDRALAELGRRYLAGYGPASERDLAAWSGLPLGQARRALAQAGPLEERDGLLALPGGFDPPAGDPAACHLLAAFDTVMLGWAGRELLVGTDHDRRVLPGGGMLRPAVLAGDRVVGTWRLPGSGRRRTLELDLFGPAPKKTALREEALDVGRFLGVEVAL